eukprot:scpid91009/ scgid17416/ Microtubule-associated protein ssm4
MAEPGHSEETPPQSASAASLPTKGLQVHVINLRSTQHDPGSSSNRKRTATVVPVQDREEHTPTLRRTPAGVTTATSASPVGVVVRASVPSASCGRQRRGSESTSTPRRPVRLTRPSASLGQSYGSMEELRNIEDTSRVLDQGSEASDHVAVGMQVEVLRQARPASLVSPREEDTQGGGGGGYTPSSRGRHTPSGRAYTPGEGHAPSSGASTTTTSQPPGGHPVQQQPSTLHTGSCLGQVLSNETATACSQGQLGIVRYIGTTRFARGEWIGVEMRRKGEGRNDGSVDGVRYFHTNTGRGLFVRRSSVRVVNKTETRRLYTAQTYMHSPVANAQAKRPLHY